MKTSDKFPLKILSQKGQSFIEYALLISFVAAIFLFMYLNGGFDESLGSVFGSSGDRISDISYDEFGGSKSGSGSSNSGGTSASADSSNSLNNSDATSFDYETLTAEDVTTAAQTTPTYTFELGKGYSSFRRYDL